jgi:hypothetical protein
MKTPSTSVNRTVEELRCGIPSLRRTLEADYIQHESSRESYERPSMWHIGRDPFDGKSIRERQKLQHVLSTIYVSCNTIPSTPASFVHVSVHTL